MNKYENMVAGGIQGACYEIELAILWARGLSKKDFNNIQRQKYGLRGFVKDALLAEHKPENEIVYTGEYDGLFG